MPEPQVPQTRREPPKKPRARPRKAEILAAVRALVAREGLGSVTVLGVAAEVPISEPSIFYHFSTKEDLLAETALSVLSEELEALQQAALSAGPGVRVVVAVIERRFSFYESRPNELELVHHHGLSLLSAHQRERAIEMVNAIFDTWELALGDGKRSKTVRRSLGPVWLMSEGLLQMQYRVAKGLLTTKHTPREMLTEVCKLARATLQA